LPAQTEQAKDTAALTGLVQGIASGNPMSGAEVILKKDGAVIGRTGVNLNGYYVFDDILPGEGYSVEIYEAGYGPQIISGIELVANRVVTNHAGMERNDTSAIEGRVIDMDTGQPMAGVSVGLNSGEITHCITFPRGFTPSGQLGKSTIQCTKK
jgi:hypothetical protein